MQPSFSLGGVSRVSLGLNGNSCLRFWDVDGTIKSKVLYIHILGVEERQKGDVQSEVDAWLE